MALLITIVLFGLIGAVIISAICIAGAYPGEQTVPILCFILACACFYFLFSNPSIRKIIEESATKQQAADYERSKPHLLYKENDCEVYEFWANGSQHYFTKCPTTTNPIGEGKYTREEQITTQ